MLIIRLLTAIYSAIYLSLVTNIVSVSLGSIGAARYTQDSTTSHSFTIIVY